MSTTTGFDIENLVRFRPGRFLCEKCAAVWGRIPKDDDAVVCPVCGVKYVVLEDDPVELDDGDSYYPHKSRPTDDDFKSKRLEYPTDLDAHGRALGSISLRLRAEVDHYPYMRGLLHALSEAKVFVHFVSWGLDWSMLGALRLTGQRIPVRGIVANATPELQMDLRNFSKESPRLEIRTVRRGAVWEEAPHQKLIVIDGLLAFVGSANMTTHGWRAAQDRREIVEVVADLARVVGLNNSHFAPQWGRLSSYGPSIEVFMGGPIF